jgi:hypothetical protein
MSSLDTDDVAPIGALTISSFCRVYNLGRTFVYSEISRGRLEARKAGSRTIILRTEADRWAACLPTLRPSGLVEA